MINPQKQTILLRAAAISLFLLISLILIRVSARKTEGTYIYPLDDTYITMSMAKNLSQHGVWGVTRYEFTSSSSTPLFLILLATCYRITGVNSWWPIALALTAGALAIIAADQFLAALSLRIRVAASLALILLVPMYIVAATGMEHCLHIWLSLMFLATAIHSIETGARARLLIFLAPIMVLVRFESLFLIGISAALLALRSRWKDAIHLLVAAAAAIGAYAWFSLAHGWEWMPSSVLLKGFDSSNVPRIEIPIRIMARAIFMLIQAPHLAFLALVLAAMLLAVERQLPRWDRRLLALLMTLLAVLAHAALARVGWLFRYEAYLIALSLVSIFLVLPLIQLGKATSIILLALGVVAFQSLARRTYEAGVNLPRASFNIYEQQFQMARFLQRYFPRSAVAANDIGWISYATDIHLLDLTGLATRDVFRDIQDRRYNTAAIEALTTERAVDLAIVYDSWFNGPNSFLGFGPLPSKWVRVCRWQINDNLYLGDSTVSFYSTQPAKASELRNALQSFTTSLPSSVTVLQN